jgi:hypothetical protein
MATTGKCDVCGTAVDRGNEPVTSGGWYNGHEYRWSAGRVMLMRVRCDNHPFDPEAESREMDAALSECLIG